MPNAAYEWELWYLNWWNDHPTLWLVACIVGGAAYIAATVIGGRLRRRS